MYDYTKCKVGDKLWSARLGEVWIVNTTEIGRYPIAVTNGRNTDEYTADGRFTRTDECPTLFPEKPVFPEQPQRFEQDQVVVLKGGKLRRYAMLSEGRHYVYTDGKDSKSAGHVYSNTFVATDLEALST